MEEKARATATRGLQELLTELLGVTPMQFRLFRGGKTLAEVEAEVVVEEAARADLLKQFVGEDPEDGEQGDDGQDKVVGGEDSEASLAVAALHADLDMVCGGLFTAGMHPSDIDELVPGDKRWTGADAGLREVVFAELLGPVLAERAARDAAVVKRFEKRMCAWLGTQEVPASSAGEAWEALAGKRPDLLALLPDRIGLQILKGHMEATRKSQVCLVLCRAGTLPGGRGALVCSWRLVPSAIAYRSQRASLQRFNIARLCRSSGRRVHQQCLRV